MILQSLYSLYDRLHADPDYAVPAFGFSPQKIAFTVVLKKNGSLSAIQDVRKVEGKKRHNRIYTVPGGAKPPGSGLNPGFLWDNRAYLLGYKPEDKKPERTAKSFAAFKDKHLELEPEIDCPAFSAVCRFFEAWNPSDAEKLAPFLQEITGFGVFKLVGATAFIHEDPAILSWWDKQLQPAEEKQLRQCLLTGEERPVTLLQPKIKGVMGAQSAGANIVSFNGNAYESYGAVQGLNAPVSQQAAFAYGAALNNLLNGPKSEKHRLRIGDTTAVFWTEKPTIAENVFTAFFAGNLTVDEDVEAVDETRLKDITILLKALRDGGTTDFKEEEGTRFHILGLAPNAARLSVRFYYQGTIGELLHNLRAHHAEMSVVAEFGPGTKRPDPEFPAVWQLLRETARETKEIPPLLAGPLMRAIIAGTPYPQSLYDAVLRRIRADRNINYLRACVIRGVLNRNHHLETTMALDLDNPNPAYRMGRLFAVLEKTQMDALGTKINATIRDKYYNAASASPRSVFPLILRTYSHHLNKLDHVGKKVNREKLMQEVLGPISDGFPAHLNLQEQGLFALGYYHQKKDFYTKKESTESTESTSTESKTTEPKEDA